MPRFEWLDPQVILPPTDMMRTTSMMDGMEEFMADIATRGVKSPIGVRDLQNTRYEVIWGARRTFAAQQTGQKLIPAMVYAPDEEDTDELMAIENLQRTPVNAAEEADMYTRLINKRGMTVAGISAQLNVSAQRVSKLLEIQLGDPAVLQALADRQISIAQATAINTFRDEFGRGQALHYAIHNGTSAQMLTNWGKEREASGLDVQMETLQEQLQDGTIPDYRNQAKCQACQEWHNLENVTHRILCAEDWDLLMQLYAAYQQQDVNVDKGAESGVSFEQPNQEVAHGTDYDPFVFGKR